MVYPAKTIANYFIYKSKTDPKSELTPMKLLKLVYTAHGWNLAINNEPLIYESVDAWKYGPVIDSLYHEFKKYGNQPITQLAQAPEIPRNDTSTYELLDEIWAKYGGYTAVQLSNWSHEPGSPWDQTWNDKNGKYYNGLPIDNETIRKYFSNM